MRTRIFEVEFLYTQRYGKTTRKGMKLRENIPAKNVVDACKKIEKLFMGAETVTDGFGKKHNLINCDFDPINVCLLAESNH